MSRVSQQGSLDLYKARITRAARASEVFAQDPTLKSDFYITKAFFRQKANGWCKSCAGPWLKTALYIVYSYTRNRIKEPLWYMKTQKTELNLRSLHCLIREFTFRRQETINAVSRERTQQAHSVETTSIQLIQRQDDESMLNRRCFNVVHITLKQSRLYIDST